MFLQITVVYKPNFHCKHDGTSSCGSDEHTGHGNTVSLALSRLLLKMRFDYTTRLFLYCVPGGWYGSWVNWLQATSWCFSVRSLTSEDNCWSPEAEGGKTSCTFFAHLLTVWTLVYGKGWIFASAKNSSKIRKCDKCLRIAFLSIILLKFKEFYDAWKIWIPLVYLKWVKVKNKSTEEIRTKIRLTLCYTSPEGCINTPVGLLEYTTFGSYICCNAKIIHSLNS